jgi:hypothetical protein
MLSELLDPVLVAPADAVVVTLVLVPFVAVAPAAPVLATAFSAEPAGTTGLYALLYAYQVNTDPLAGVDICPGLSNSVCVPGAGVFAGLYSEPVPKGAVYPRPLTQSTPWRYCPQFDQRKPYFAPMFWMTLRPMRSEFVFGQTS